jgi:protein-tyrosine phosphatase
VGGVAAAKRDLAWPDCHNVRDLGGLPIAGGGRTRWGVVVRGDAPDQLTASGWAALEAHGVRTIVDLRNDDELRRDAAPRPRSVTTVHLALDGPRDNDFWECWASGPQFGTPLYYGPFLERFPERVAPVITAVARAEPGGVLVHCGGGRDRAGMISALLLSLAGVAPEDVAADYALGAAGVRAQNERAVMDEFLARRGTTGAELVSDLLATLDVEAYVRDAGVSAGDLAAVRARLAG